MELKELTTEDYPDNSIVVDDRIHPQDLMLEVNMNLDRFNLKVIQYKTYNDSYCFVIVKK